MLNDEIKKTVLDYLRIQKDLQEAQRTARDATQNVERMQKRIEAITATLRETCTGPIPRRIVVVEGQVVEVTKSCVTPLTPDAFVV